MRCLRLTLFLTAFAGLVLPAAAAERAERVEYLGKPARYWIRHGNDRDPAVRARAARALSRLAARDAEAVAVLQAALSDPQAEVRSAGATAVGELGLTGMVSRVVALAASDPDPHVRVAAMRALGGLGSRAWGAEGETAVAGLRKGPPELRLAAAETLGRLGVAQPEAVQFLVKALRDADVRVADAAAASLQRLRSARVMLDVLSQFLRHPDSAVRERAAGVLAASCAEGVPVLAAALRDSDPAIRSLAAKALGRTADAALPELLAALSEPGPQRKPAIEALAGAAQESGDAVAWLAVAVDDPDPEVAAAAAHGLGRARVARDGATAALAGAAAGRRPAVAEAAFSALAAHGAQGVGALVHVLSSSADAMRRRLAAAALGKLGAAGGDGVAALEAALADADVGVRRAAAESLGDIGPSAAAAIPALRRAAAAQDRALRDAARRALESIERR